ncbi:MAG: hypothetical protein JO041_09845 [Acidobacteria bacterium]|nr:hypothetical protein [Acidobacteriota bacterium]
MPEKQERVENRDSNKEDERLRRELRRDPEFEMPDPEQVDGEIKEAEKVYRKDDPGENAA